MASILFFLAGIAVMIFMATRVLSFGYDHGDGVAVMVGVGLILTGLV